MPAPERTIGKLVLSVGGRILRELLIDRKRVTIGRRPYNDLLLDDLTVSGEHAIVHTGPGGEAVVHDLQSRNGTLVNGVPVMQQVLTDGDVIDVGIYRIVYQTESLHFDVNSFAPPEASRGPVTRAVGELPGPLAGADGPGQRQPGDTSARPVDARPSWSSFLGGARDRSGGAGGQGGQAAPAGRIDAAAAASERSGTTAEPSGPADPIDRGAGGAAMPAADIPGGDDPGSGDVFPPIIPPSAQPSAPSSPKDPPAPLNPLAQPVPQGGGPTRRGPTAAGGPVRPFVPPRVPAPVEPWRFGRVLIRYLGGHDAGREVVIDRPIVSIRNGSGQVAVIARRQGAYYLTHLEGLTYPLVNGESIGLGAHALRDNDLIELAGTILQFCLDSAGP